MTTETKPVDETTAVPSVPAADSQPAEGREVPANTAPVTTDATVDVKSRTSAEVAQLIEKARAEEKSKVYQKIELLDKEKKDAMERIAKLDAELKSTTANLDELRQGKTSEVDSIAKELQELRDKNQKLEMAIEVVAQDAAEKLLQSEVAAYRERAIRESGVTLTELVAGSTVEEVNESIVRAKAREEEMRKRFEAEILRTQQAAPPADAPAPANIPRPVSPDGSQGLFSTGELTPTKREELAKLPREEYERRRAELLAQAKQKAGLL